MTQLELDFFLKWLSARDGGECIEAILVQICRKRVISVMVEGSKGEQTNNNNNKKNDPYGSNERSHQNCSGYFSPATYKSTNLR